MIFGGGNRNWRTIFMDGREPPDPDEVTGTFLGLAVGNQVDVILMLVEEHLSRHVLETIARVGKFDETSGTGIAFQVDVEDAIGVRHQIQALEGTLEEII